MGELVLIIVIIVRTLVPFTILRYPLAGALLAIAGDISDVMLFERFGSGPLTDDLYHNFDKIFDTYYLFFEFLVVHRWKETLARRIGKGLFLWRFIGFTLFETIGIRWAFFAAPNIFENFYLAWTVLRKYFPKFLLGNRGILALLAIVALPKLIQEYIMHFAYPDQTWNFLRDHFFWWLYR